MGLCGVSEGGSVWLCPGLLHDKEKRNISWLWGEVGTKTLLKSLPAQECAQESLPHFTGGSRNRGYARKPFGIQTKKSEPGTQTLVIYLITPCTQAAREVKPLQGKMALTTFKNNAIQKYQQQFRGRFIFLCLSSLLSSFLAFLCFASTDSTERLPVTGQFHFSQINPRDCGAKQAYINCCVAG